MLFCQFYKSNSLNDVCKGMRSATGDLNHLGVTKAMKRSWLAYNNQHCNLELFQARYFNLHDQFESTVKNSHKLLPKRKIYLLDSTKINLFLKAFDCALFRKKKVAFNLHTVLDFDRFMPVLEPIESLKSYLNNKLQFAPFSKNFGPLQSELNRYFFYICRRKSESISEHLRYTACSLIATGLNY